MGVQRGDIYEENDRSRLENEIMKKQKIERGNEASDACVAVFKKSISKALAVINKGHEEIKLNIITLENSLHLSMRKAWIRG